MKNIIFITVDSLFYDRLLKKNSNFNAAPFLNSIKNESIWCSNMYSEASYTEAALNSLLCGVDTLKNGGYFNRLKYKTNISEVFEKNGYDTFCCNIQQRIYPSFAYPKFKYNYYNTCYDFSAAWEYRLKYLSELYCRGEFDEDYFTLSLDILEDNFINWIQFLEDVINDNERCKFIKKYLFYDDYYDNLKYVVEEYDKFKKNKKEYLISLFKLKNDHILLKLKRYYLKYEDDNFVSNRCNKYEKLFKKIFMKNLFLNLKNNRVNFINGSFTNNLRLYKNILFNGDLLKKTVSTSYKKTLIAPPSCLSHFNFFKDWFINVDHKSPFFAYIHFDDVHYPECFFSHDIMDYDVMIREKKMIEKFVNSIPKNYKGSIEYDLSIYYVDNCIKDLYNFINSYNSNTIFVVTADHGSSFSFYPGHYNYVLNEHRENYHIPFIVFGKGIHGKECKGFYNSKDIPATILDLCNVKVPLDFYGKSILSFPGRSHALIENIIGGCPDYHKRIVTIGSRNNRYSVTMDFDMNGKFSNGTIRSVYDLEKDKNENYNLKDKINMKLIQSNIDFIKSEFYSLKKDISINDFKKRMK